VVQGWHLRDQIVIFRKIAETMVREFAEAALGLAFMSEAVEAFTEAAEGIIGLVEEGLKATALLAGFNFGAAVQGWHLRDQIVIFRKIAETMVREFAEAALGLAFMSEAVEAFTEAAEGVIGLVEEGLRAVVLLAGFNFGAAVQGWHLRDQIVIFRNIVRTMVREFAEAAGEFGSMAESVSAFTEAAEGVIGLVEDGLKAAVALSEIDFGAVVQGWHLRDQIETFRNIIRTLIREFAEAATEFGSMAESVEAFADAADAVLGLVVDGIEAIQALSETDFGALVQGWHLAGQIETFRNIIRTLIREFAEAATEFGSMATSVEAMADAAGAVVDLVGPAIEAIGLLANYEAVAGIRVAATAFSLQLAAVLTAFSEAFAAAANGAEEAMSEAANFAETAGDILDVVAPGIEALGVIATYEAVAGIRVAATAFALQLVAVVMALTDAFEQAGILANEAVIEAGEMSGALEDIVSVVEPAVEAVVALVGYNTVGGLQTNVRQFAADLVVVIQTLVDGLKQAGLLANEAVAEAGEMAKSIADILKVVEPALHPDKGALPLIAKYVSAGGLVQKAQQFTADLIAVTQVLVDGLTTSALAAGVALTKAGEMAKSLKDLFDAVGNGIDAINDIANYTKGANLAQKTGEFTDDLVTVATVIVTGLTAAANKLGAEAVSAAHAFAQSVGLIVSRVRSVVMDLNELGSVATPSIEPKLAYIAASAEQIAKAFSAAGDIGAAVKYAEVFRTNLEQLVQEVKLAVALLAALAGTGTSGPVGAALGAIAAALQNTAGQFAGAGRALAEAFVAMLTVGIAGGAGAAVGATVTVLGAAYNAGMAAAKAFVAVGVAISQAIAAGVLSGQGQVISAVVQVIGAASAAGTAEARKATAVGQELVRSVLAEISGARGALDSAGSAAGVALIDGMVRAITAGKSRLVNAIRESVGAGIAAAKAALGIASPSRVAFELMANFMRTAAIPLSDPRGLVKAIGQSTRAMVAEAARAIGDIGQVQGLVAAPMTAGTVGSGSTMRLTQPALAAVAPQPATPRGLVQPGPVYNFYGNWTVEGVEDGPGLLEQLASIAAGARGR
jgi:hypothetical protein